MKLQFETDVKELDAWKKKPYGYAVLFLADGVKLQLAATGPKIELVRLPTDAEKANRKMERIREEYDKDPVGMKPKLIVGSRKILLLCPAAVQLKRRSVLNWGA